MIFESGENQLRCGRKYGRGGENLHHCVISIVYTAIRHTHCLSLAIKGKANLKKEGWVGGRKTSALLFFYSAFPFSFMHVQPRE
jgi:hypothetical protein